jgi:hypothetical protein
MFPGIVNPSIGWRLEMTVTLGCYVFGLCRALDPDGKPVARQTARVAHRSISGGIQTARLRTRGFSALATLQPGTN